MTAPSASWTRGHYQPAALSACNFAAKHVRPGRPRAHKMSTPYFLQALSRLCWEKVIMKAAEATAKRFEKRTWTVPSARVWLFQRSGLLQQKHRRQFQEKNCRCAGPCTTDWWGIPRQSYCQKLGTWLNHCDMRQWYSPSKLLATQRLEDGIIPTKLPGGDELSSRSKVKVPWWPKRRSLPSKWPLSIPQGRRPQKFWCENNPFNLGASGAKADGSEQLQDFLACNSLGAKDSNKSSVVEQRLCDSKIYVARPPLRHLQRGQPKKKKTNTRRDKYSSSRTHTHTLACMHTRTVWVSLSLSLSLSLWQFKVQHQQAVENKPRSYLLKT